MGIHAHNTKRDLWQASVDGGNSDLNAPDIRKNVLLSTHQLADTGYYSPPDFGTDNAKLENDVYVAEKAAEKITADYAALQESKQRQEQTLKVMTEELQRLRSAGASADMINKCLEHIETAHSQYLKTAGSFKEKQGAAQKAVDDYNAAVKNYNTYAEEQKKEYDRWRSRIRDPQTVETELSRLDKKDPFHEPKIRQLEEELDWSKYFYYSDFQNAADFAENNKYVPQERRQQSLLGMTDAYSGTSGWEDPLYEAINGNKEAQAWLQNSGAASYGRGTIGSVFGRVADGKTESQQMTEEEVAIFNYLYKTQGPESAEKYYDYILTDLNYRQRKEDEAYWRKYAKEDPFGASVFSVTISPLKGLSYLGQTADYVADGKIDQNAAYNKFSYTGTAIREQVTKNWGKVGSFAYQTAMSMADFLLSTALSGGKSAVAMTIMGTGAAADTTLAAKDRGLEDWQAFTLGTVAGIAEAVTEKFSVEALLSPDMLTDGALKFVLKNALTEGTEEVASSTINLFADILVSQDKSEWAQSIQAYRDQDKNENEAFVAAFADQAEQLGWDFLGGVASGGILGGGRVTFNKLTNVIGNKTGQTETDIKQQISSVEDAGTIEADDALQALANGQEEGQPVAPEQVVPEVDTQMVRPEQQGAETNGLEQESQQVAANENIDENENGGNEYGTLHQQSQQSADVGLANRQADAGAGLLYGGSQRNDGTGTGEQTGGLAGRTGSATTGRGLTADQLRTQNQRYALRQNIRTPKVSSQSLGIQTGTETANLQEVPQEYWDEGMRTKAEQVYQETGKQVRYVLGSIQVYGRNGKTVNVRGVTTEGGIVVQADNLRYTAEQIADHESYHGMKRAYSGGINLNRELIRRIQKKFTRGEFDRVAEAYTLALRETVDVAGAKDGAEYEQRMDQLFEEILADAYAGMNAFGAGATQFTETVNQFLDENGISRKTTQENGTAEPTGPPMEAASIEEGKGQYSAEEYDNPLLALTGERKTAQKNTAQDGGERYSITEPFVDNNGTQFDSAVLLDTEFFNGLSPRNWGSKLRSLVKMRADTDPFILPIADENGNVQQLQFADPSDRVTKNGGQDHNVLNELASGDDNISKLAVVHIDEIVDVSEEGNPYYSADNAHGWLDDKGWLHRTANVINAKNGNVYELTLDIAKTKDGRHILFATKGKIKRVGNANVNSLNIRGSKLNSNSNNKVSQPDSTVKRKEMEYQFAVEHGDVTAAQRLVEQAAADAGYTVRAYHGTSSDFWAFEKGKKRTRGNLNFGDGFYFTPDRSMAENYTSTGRVVDAFLKLENPYTVYGTRFYNDDLLQMSLQFGKEVSIENVAEVLQQMGYDGIVARNYDGVTNPVNQYVVFDSNKIKSADPVTYDDDGNVIPLSERFNQTKNDIRYSVEEDLSNEEWESQYGLSLSNTENANANSHSFTEVEISSAEIEENIQKAAQMHPVTQITGEEFAKSEKDLVSQVVEFFGEQNNSAHNSVLGDVVLDRRGVKSDIAHGIGRKKAAAFAAVPSVIEHGVVVDYQRNWKGRGYDTAVIAAPITIGTEEHMAAVVLTRSNQTNRFYVHEVMTTKNGATPFKTGTRKTGESGGNAPSVFSILDKIMKVKTQHGGTVETYSVDDEDNSLLALKGEGQPVDYEALENQYAAENRNSRAQWFTEKLGEEGYQKYREYAADRDEQKKQQSREEQAQKTRERKARIDDRMQENIQKLTEREEKAKQAVKPAKAKRELKATVLNLFSIPAGQRAELGSMIDGYADRLLKNGNLTEADRQHFFDRMYEAGVMTVPVDDYFAEARSHIAKGRIYVNPQVRSDFGDDWNSIRKRAFAAGVYLVNDRSASGIDQWNATLSAEDMLPGLFNSEDTDERTILEKIIQVAEEGKDEKMSLAEYTAMLSGQGYVQENEFLDSMERQLDFALRSFVQSAGIEISVKENNIKENAKLTRESIKQKARSAAEREERKEAARRSQAQKELRELQQKTLKQLQWLSKNRNRAPEELRDTWDEVLGDIDLYAVGAADEMRWSEKHQATWKDLAEMYKHAKEYDPNFLPSEELQRIVDRLDGDKIADMDIGALQDLYKAAVGLRTEFYNRNNVINDEMRRLFAEVYTDAKGEIENAPGGYKGTWLDKKLNLDQLTPMNVLQRMGGWDPKGAFYSMAKQLEAGERDIRAYTVKANRMLSDFLIEYEDWVKRADGQGKDAIWYELEVPELLELGMGHKPIFGDTVTVYMTPAQKVHLYLESKNQDNLRHMTGGRTFADKELYSQGKRQEAFAQGKSIRLAPETVKQIVSDLTAEELELARVLEQYYNSFAKQEINRVSNILYGYDKAMGSFYAPIYSNRNYTKTEVGVFDATAEGVGNMKERHISKNPTYNIGAFDAFERHVEQTARFCGMAIPARNWTTLLNWQEKNNSTGDVITHKWGEEGKQYITDLITSLQAGEGIKTDTVSSGIDKLQSNYISSVFGANPSIVLKQLGSIPMASAYLGASNLPSLQQIGTIDRAFIAKYTQELDWRMMGYTTPETKFLKDNPNWTQTNKFTRFTFGGGAITAMDGWAASVLWPWAENKVRKEYPELEVGTQAQIDAGESPFYKKVAEEFNDAVTRSQSVSDQIHQSTLRKSKNPATRAFTLFRSDSAQTYNTIRQKIGEARYAVRTGADGATVKAAKTAAGAAFMALAINAIWGESVSMLMALVKNKGKYYRDDEEELTAESVSREMVRNMIESIAGTVIWGEELAEIIGNVITGDKWYGIETPGMEQLNDVVEEIIDTGKGLKDFFAGAVDVINGGGDFGEYIRAHGNEFLGCVKAVAETYVKYFKGVPAVNVEAYLLGAVKWVCPEFAAAYEDAFSEMEKDNLSGLSGGALADRIGRMLGRRGIELSNDTLDSLALLYEAGHTGAVPADIPESVTIGEETYKLSGYQKQAYGDIWNQVVGSALDELAVSAQFARMDEETQAKALSRLYSYATAKAKEAMFDYELSDSTNAIDKLVKAGLGTTESVSWATATSGMKAGEKYAYLRDWAISDDKKRALIGSMIGTDMKTNAGNPTEYAKMLDALKQGMTVNEYLDMKMEGADIDDYLKATENGMDSDTAQEFASQVEQMETNACEGGLENIDKWRLCVDFTNDIEDQLAALAVVMSDTQIASAELANKFGVTPDMFVTFYELRSQYDTDKNGSFSQKEVTATIDSRFSHMSQKQKAVLWQIANSSTKNAKNNPYNVKIGQEVLDAKAAAKG